MVARAQQGERVRRIGMLMSLDENDPEQKRLRSAFTQALADLGWTVGRNVRMDFRSAGGDINQIPALAQELVGLQPDIILATSTAVTVALQRETRTTPIVFVGAGDPVASGLVRRLDRPGRNITGFAYLDPPWEASGLAALGGRAWAQAGRHHVQSRHVPRICLYALT